MAGLALDYRPHKFSEVVGQKHVRPILRAMVRTERVPAALLFAGSRGTGKTTCGRILAAALNCESPEGGDACAECVQCVAVQTGRSLAVIEVDAASNGQVDDIRKLKDVVGYAHEGTWRVVLLDEAHSMSKEAFNALLKMLEEPPAHTVFLLLTTEPDKIIETVRSRSMAFEFRRLTHEDIMGQLVHIAADQSLDVEEELLAEIANRVQGGMRDAVMLLDQVSRVDVHTAEAFREMFGIRNVAVELLIAASEQDYPAGSAIIDDQFYRVGDASAMVSDLVLLVRDLLVLKAGGEVQHNGLDLQERERLARRLPVDRLVAAISSLWEFRSRGRYGEHDQQAAMHMAFILVTEALADQHALPIQKTNGNGNGHKKLSLDEMVAMSGS